MEQLITAMFSKSDNIAIIVLTLGCAGLGYLHIVWRREEREDRKAATAALEKLVEALNQVRSAIAAVTGKVP